VFRYDEEGKPFTEGNGLKERKYFGLFSQQTHQ
jgi:hypothetical protein